MWSRRSIILNDYYYVPYFYHLSRGQLAPPHDAIQDGTGLQECPLVHAHDAACLIGECPCLIGVLNVKVPLYYWEVQEYDWKMPVFD